MSGAESFAFEPGAPDSDQRPYGEQQFDPTLLEQEFNRRHQRFGEFVTREIGAFHLHEAIVRQRIAEYGEPTFSDMGKNSYHLAYQHVNYDPEPGDSEKRRIISIGTRVTAAGVRVPFMAVASMEEATSGVKPASSFIRGEIGVVDKLLKGHGATTRNLKSYTDAFIGQGPENEWVQKQIATQAEYIGWLRIVADYIGVGPILRPFVAPQQPQQTSQN